MKHAKGPYTLPSQQFYRSRPGSLKETLMSFPPESEPSYPYPQLPLFMRSGYPGDRSIGISPSQRNMFSESLLRKRQFESQIKVQDLRDQVFSSRAGKRPVLLPDEIDEALKPAGRGGLAGTKDLNPEQGESEGKKEGSSELKKDFDKESSQTEAKKEEL